MFVVSQSTLHSHVAQIAEQSPPLEDIPADVPSEVRSLIESGWTVDGKKRPFAHEILSHAAFQYSSKYSDSINFIHTWIFHILKNYLTTNISDKSS